MSLANSNVGVTGEWFSYVFEIQKTWVTIFKVCFALCLHYSFIPFLLKFSLHVLQRSGQTGVEVFNSNAEILVSLRNIPQLSPPPTQEECCYLVPRPTSCSTRTPDP